MMLSPLGRWEDIEYFGEAVVILGVLGEYLGEFHLFQKEEQEKKRRRITKLSTRILLVGLALELSGLVRTSQLYEIEVVAARLDASKAQLSAGEANATGQAATLQAASANERAGKAIIKAAGLEKEAATLRRQAEELRQRNLETESRVTEANQKLEGERTTRLEMEKSLSPRLLPFKEFTDGTTNIDDLKPFAGIEAVLEFIQDAEAERTALNLAFLLQKAGWKVVASHPISSLPWDGVTIGTYMPVLHAERRTSRDDIAASMASHDIGIVLVRFLRENDWEANLQSDEPGLLSPNTLRVVIGLKPYPYFGSPTSKAAQELLDKTFQVNKRRNENKTIREELLMTGPHQMREWTRAPTSDKKP